MTALGIDFGTTNSVVSVYSGNAPETLEIDTPPAEWGALGFGRVLPTVFALAEGDRPVFGWEAKLLPGERLEAVKRLFREEEVVSIGGHQFVVEEIATMLFSHMKRRALDLGVASAQAVVTIPANSRGLARYRTKLTAGMAGMEVLALINEPTAAAMAFSARMPFDQRVMVVDWGGGTLDVTILQADSGVFIEQASKGIQQCGGLDFDNRIAQRVVSTIGDAGTWTPAEKAQFRIAVEMAKIRLSSQDFTNVELPRGGNVRLERSQFEEDARPLVERVRQPIEQTLRDIDADSRAIDAVILVGGTCKIPLVRSFIADIVGREPVSGIDPMTAIAEGAAIAGAILTGEAPDNDFFVGTEHALGTYVVNQGGPRTFSTIIPRNHKLPAQATEWFVPVGDLQEQILMEVVEGEPGTDERNPENVVLKSWELVLDTTRESQRDKAVEVTYSYDVDGILEVTVVDRLTGEVMLRDDVSFGFSQDKRALVQMAGRAQSAVEGGQLVTNEVASSLDPRTADVLQKAKNKVIPFLDDQEAAAIRALVAEVEDGTGFEQQSALHRLEVALQPYSYLL